MSIDLWYRYMSERPSFTFNPWYARRAFSELDLRLAWKPRKDLELSLVGQNLNDGACDAYSGLTIALDYSKTVPTCMRAAPTVRCDGISESGSVSLIGFNMPLIRLLLLVLVLLPTSGAWASDATIRLGFLLDFARFTEWLAAVLSVWRPATPKWRRNYPC